MAQGNADRPRRNFKRVHFRRQVKGTTQRDPAGATVLPTGHTMLNANARDQFDYLAQARGLDVRTYVAGFGTLEEADCIALYPEPADSPDTVAIRRDQRRRRASFSMDPLFDLIPALRPTARHRCTIASCPQVEVQAGTHTPGLSGDCPLNAQRPAVPSRVFCIAPGCIQIF